MKKLLSSPVTFLCLTLPVPAWCAVKRLMACDDPAGMLGWILPLVTLLFVVAALVLLLVAWLRKREAVVQGGVLWKLLGLSLLFCGLADYHLYKTVYLAQLPEIVEVISSSLFLTMGGCCLFWAALRRWSFLIWVPFLLLGLFQAIGFLEYGAVLNSLVLAETLEANAAEVMAYLTPINIAAIVLVLLLVTGLCWLLNRILRYQKRSTLANTGVLFFALGFLTGLPIPVQDEDTDLYWPYAEGYRVYFTVQEALYANVATIECARNLPSPAKDPSSIPTLQGKEGVVLIVHVGESVRADRMGLNGYPRETTPWLSSQAGKGLINFPDCISSAYDTCQAQIAILTDGRRDVFEKDPALVPHVGSVLDLFAANGFDVYSFRGIRCGEKLKYDRVVRLLTHCAVKCCNAPGEPMSVLPQMQDVLAANPGRNLVLFINNEGSHTPFNYYDHANPPFTPCVDSFEIPSQHAEEVNNAYDNTIHYTDEFIHRVVQLLDGRPFVYLYVSDHGEYLGHDGLWGRGGLGAGKPAYHETTGCRVGMFLIHSPEFPGLHPHFAEAISQLASHTGLTVAHEHIFHTLLGIFGVQTPHYNAKLDLCSPQAEPYTGPRPAAPPAPDTLDTRN